MVAAPTRATRFIRRVLPLIECRVKFIQPATAICVSRRAKFFPPTTTGCPGSRTEFIQSATASCAGSRAEFIPPTTTGCPGSRTEFIQSATASCVGSRAEFIRPTTGKPHNAASKRNTSCLKWSICPLDQWKSHTKYIRQLPVHGSPVPIK